MLHLVSGQTMSDIDLPALLQLFDREGVPFQISQFCGSSVAGDGPFTFGEDARHTNGNFAFGLLHLHALALLGFFDFKGAYQIN
jgi:hypothetical protein